MLLAPLFLLRLVRGTSLLITWILPPMPCFMSTIFFTVLTPMLLISFTTMGCHRFDCVGNYNSPKFFHAIISTNLLQGLLPIGAVPTMGHTALCLCSLLRGRAPIILYAAAFMYYYLPSTCQLICIWILITDLHFSENSVNRTIFSFYLATMKSFDASTSRLKQFNQLKTSCY